MYTLFYQQLFEDIMQTNNKNNIGFFASLSELFKYTKADKKTDTKAYDRDYFIPEDGYLIFD